MRKVFVCSPFGGKQTNIDRAKDYCRFVVSSKDRAPFAPHLLYPQFLKDTGDEREIGIYCGCEFLSECDEMWIFLPPGEELSDGMKREIVCASQNNILIAFMYKQYLEWARGEKRVGERG